MSTCSFCSKRRHDEEKSFNGHSFLPAIRGASTVEPPFFWSLGIRGRNQWKEPCFQDWSTSSSFDVRKMLGCCGQIARRWHCLGAQVFVFLAKYKGDSLWVTTLADEKKVISFTACDDVYAWWPDSGSGAESQWTTLSQLVWQDTDLTRPKCCILDRFWTFSTSRWKNIVDAANLSQSTCCRLGHHQCGKASSQGEYSESSTHVQAVLPTVGLAESACGYDCEQLLLALDHSECARWSPGTNVHSHTWKWKWATCLFSLTGLFMEGRREGKKGAHACMGGCTCWETVRVCVDNRVHDSEELFPKFRTPTSLMVQVKNKTQTGQFFDIGFFGIKACHRARPHSAGSGADDYVWRK